MIALVLITAALAAPSTASAGTRARSTEMKWTMFHLVNARARRNHGLRPLRLNARALEDRLAAQPADGGPQDRLPHGEPLRHRSAATGPNRWGENVGMAGTVRAARNGRSWRARRTARTSSAARSTGRWASGVVRVRRRRLGHADLLRVAEAAARRPEPGRVPSRASARIWRSATVSCARSVTPSIASCRMKRRSRSYGIGPLREERLDRLVDRAGRPRPRGLVSAIWRRRLNRSSSIDCCAQRCQRVPAAMPSSCCLEPVDLQPLAQQEEPARDLEHRTARGVGDLDDVGPVHELALERVPLGDLGRDALGHQPARRVLVLLAPRVGADLVDHLRELVEGLRATRRSRPPGAGRSRSRGTSGRSSPRASRRPSSARSARRGRSARRATSTAAHRSTAPVTSRAIRNARTTSEARAPVSVDHPRDERDPLRVHDVVRGDRRDQLAPQRVLGDQVSEPLHDLAREVPLDDPARGTASPAGPSPGATAAIARFA